MANMRQYQVPLQRYMAMMDLQVFQIVQLFSMRNMVLSRNAV